MDAGVTIWGKGMMFTGTAGILILVNSGLFSLGGCMVGVLRRETPLSFSATFIRHSLSILVPTVRSHPLPARTPRFHLGSHFKAWIVMRYDATRRNQVSCHRCLTCGGIISYCGVEW